MYEQDYNKLRWKLLPQKYKLQVIRMKQNPQQHKLEKVKMKNWDCRNINRY